MSGYDYTYGASASKTVLAKTTPAPDGDRPTRIDALLDEAVLRRPVGGATVTRGQLHHLLTLSRRRHVTVQVVPLAAGAHAGLDGSFWIFELPRPYPEVAYVESLGGRLYLELPKSERFVQAYHRLRQVALGETESAARIAEIAEELDG